MNNTPIYGCEGCKTTGGRMSCSTHGGQITFINGIEQLKDDWGRSICPKHKTEFTCPDCMEEIAQEISRANYEKLLT